MRNTQLKFAIFAAGLSQRQVAAKLAVDDSTLSKWVQGRWPLPVKRAKALSEILGVEIFPASVHSE